MSMPDVVYGAIRPGVRARSAPTGVVGPAARAYGEPVERWEYRVVPWPAGSSADSDRLRSLEGDAYAQALEDVLGSLGSQGFELSQVVERPPELGGRRAQQFLVLRRVAPTGEAAYERENLDYAAGEF